MSQLDRPVLNMAGAEVGRVTLDAATFGIVPNEAVMHQVVTAQLAARRAGTHSTKTRAEVRGGGSKPYRQKGTGRARQGSTRAPQFVGGGIVFGPKPRDYHQRTPKKMIALALRSALSDRLNEDRIVVVDSYDLPEAKTKAAATGLKAVGTSGRVLLVAAPESEVIRRCVRNLPSVDVLRPGALSALAVLKSDWVVFDLASLPGQAVAATESGGVEQ
jgi:large subunit ribosomal protein L4